MNNVFPIRRADIADAASLAAISMEVWIATYLREGVSGFFADYALNQFTRDKMAGILCDKNETIWVSQNSIGPDGFLRLTQNSKAPIVGCSDVELTTLYVQQKHQGKGKAAALLKKCLAQNPWLMVNAENNRAIAFYQKHGFEIIGETYFTIDDSKYLNQIMTIG